MYNLNENKAPLTVNEVIKKPFHKYLTKFSEKSPKAISLKYTKYSISFRDPKIWNTFLTKEGRKLQPFSIFTEGIYSKLLEGECELKYF